jgi:hypothetical protein
MEWNFKRARKGNNFRAEGNFAESLGETARLIRQSQPLQAFQHWLLPAHQYGEAIQ